MELRELILIYEGQFFLASVKPLIYQSPLATIQEFECLFLLATPTPLINLRIP